MLLDEPYSGIDASSARDLAALIQRWNAEGRTIVSVLHDLEHVRRDYPQTLLLAREAVAWGATAEVLSEAHLARARRLAETASATASRSEAEICHANAVGSEHSPLENRRNAHEPR